MKFYYNGKLVRTSTHNYTHAVINTKNGNVVGCRTSEDAAQKVISSEISQYRTGIQNTMSLMRALEQGKKSYLVKVGHRSFMERITESHSIQRCQEWIESNEKQIEYIRKNWKVVELEVR